MKIGRGAMFFCQGTKDIRIYVGEMELGGAGGGGGMAENITTFIVD